MAAQEKGLIRACSEPALFVAERDELVITTARIRKTGPGISRACSDTAIFTGGTDKLVVATPETRNRENIKRIQDEINENPHCLGIVLVFRCVTPKDINRTKSLFGLESAAEKVCDVGRKLGYLPLVLEGDASSYQIKERIKLLTKKLTLPKSYLHITVYFAGYGRINTICTTDGDLRISNIVELFDPSACPQLQNVIKFFVFDCCRTHDWRLEDRWEHFETPNSFFLFALMPMEVAYYFDSSVPDHPKRCGRMTEHFLKQMLKFNPFLSLPMLTQRELRENGAFKFVFFYHTTYHRDRVNLLYNSVGTCRVVPTDLEANQVQDTLCFQLTGKFRGCVERVSKIEIEAVDKQGKRITVAATTEPSSDRDGSFKATTHPLQMWSTYQLRAVAIYRDAEGGGPGKFRAHSAEITVTVQGLNQI